MQIDPQKISQQERYKLEIGCIVPRPIAFVSTRSAKGISNLAPFSFFSGVSSNPMTLLFCPANKADGSEKDTLRNIEASKEFVVNIMSEDFVKQVSACAEELAYEQSEFALAGLTEAPAVKIKAARVVQAKVSFECKLLQLLRLNPGQPAGGNVVIGEVCWLHIDDALINEQYHIDPTKLRAAGRMGGLNYCSTNSPFSVPWGKKALE